MYSLLTIYAAFVVAWYWFVFRAAVSAVTIHAAERSRAEESADPRTARLARNVAALRSALRPTPEMDGTIVVGRVDCTAEIRYCDNDSDCASLCREYERARFVCSGDKTCVTRAVRVDDNGGAIDECDTRRGEYAVLVGYTNVGAAEWRCVQLYKQYADRSKYCEGGEFDMNATVREPSYRDCSCPDGTVRCVYNIASVYESNLPHCVPKASWRFYRNSMRAV